MNETIPYVRRAAVAIFIAHVTTATLAMAIAWAIYRHSPDAFATSAAPFGDDDLVETAAQLRLAMLGLRAQGWTVLACIATQMLMGLVLRAFWVHGMAGAEPHAALRRALRAQPALWLLALGHGIWQGAVIAALLRLAPALSGWLTPHTGIAIGDGLAALLFPLWGVTALLVSVVHDLAFARVALLAAPVTRALRSAARSASARLTLAKAAYLLIQFTCLAAASLCIAFAWPDRFPLVLLVALQSIALVGTFAHAFWVATTVKAVAGVVQSEPDEDPGAHSVSAWR